jgi:hypothetical protein
MNRAARDPQDREIQFDVRNFRSAGSAEVLVRPSAKGMHLQSPTVSPFLRSISVHVPVFKTHSPG